MPGTRLVLGPAGGRTRGPGIAVRRTASLRSPMTNLTALDLGEISHGPRRFSYLVQQPEPVGPQFPILDIDRDLVEERVYMRAELRHSGHGGGEILLCDGGVGLGFGNADGASECLFLGLGEQACVRRTGVGGVVLLL